MLPTIVTGATLALRASHVQNLTTPTTQLIHLVADKSIKLAQINELLSRLALSARLPRLVWIEEASSLTVPAQNAILKLLEEPPRDTAFYLTCDSPRSLLPTIRSRCHLVRLTASETSDPAVLTNLKEILALPLPDRLTSISKMTREQAATYFVELQHSLKLKLRDTTATPPQRATLNQIAQLALSAHSRLTSNVGVSLAYESFLLHLPKTR